MCCGSHWRRPKSSERKLRWSFDASQRAQSQADHSVAAADCWKLRSFLCLHCNTRARCCHPLTATSSVRVAASLAAGLLPACDTVRHAHWREAPAGSFHSACRQRAFPLTSRHLQLAQRPLTHSSRKCAVRSAVARVQWREQRNAAVMQRCCAHSTSRRSHPTRTTHTSTQHQASEQ